MDESELLKLIEKRSREIELSGSELLVGPGDDAAVVRTPGGDVLLMTVDQLVETRHFSPGIGIDLIARKAIARSVSDIAAMGGVPVWSMVTGLLPAGFDRGDELFSAMSRWANHWGCPLIGGDIAAGPGPLSLTVTICGRMDPGTKPILRSGARIGDQLWLTGPIGGSFDSGRHLTFEPRLDMGRRAADCERVHAMIDISDGLGRDAGRVGRGSGVTLEIDADKLPLNAGVADWQQALGQGEDHELLIVGQNLNREMPELLGPIGIVREDVGCGAVVVDREGGTHVADEFGWSH